MSCGNILNDSAPGTGMLDREALGMEKRSVQCEARVNACSTLAFLSPTFSTILRMGRAIQSRRSVVAEVDPGVSRFRLGQVVAISAQSLASGRLSTGRKLHRGRGAVGTLHSSADTDLIPERESIPALRRGMVRKPKKEATLVLERDRLESSPQEKVVVAATVSLGVFAMLRIFWEMHCLLAAETPQAAHLYPVVRVALEGATALFAHIMADFASGIYHFFLDNYGSRETPIFGEQIAAFQGHHQYPWTITHRDFCNNVFKSCVNSLLPLLLVAFSGAWGTSAEWTSIYLRSFSCVFFLSVAFAQEFHKWSHMIRPPSFAMFLQRSGWLISQRAHGQHHQSPYHEKYCIVSGWCNQLLDDAGFFRVLEMLIWHVTGVEPLTWRLGASRIPSPTRESTKQEASRS